MPIKTVSADQARAHITTLNLEKRVAQLEKIVAELEKTVKILLPDLH